MLGAYLIVVLLGGVGYLLADRRGWIKSERVRAFLRKVYGLDRRNGDDDAES